MDDEIRQAKLAKLVETEGYDSSDELLEAVFSSPAICMNVGCDFTCEMEPDQNAGYCEECCTNTMTAAPVLAGLI